MWGKTFEYIFNFNSLMLNAIDGDIIYFKDLLYMNIIAHHNML